MIVYDKKDFQVYAKKNLWNTHAHFEGSLVGMCRLHGPTDNTLVRLWMFQ